MAPGLSKARALRPANELSEQLITAAMELAAEGGFEHVKQRDVAARAGVTLRTLYKRFRSKDELLAAGMSRMTEQIERRLSRKPIVGDTPEERLSRVFERITRTLCAKPPLARAIVRVMASGVPEVASQVVDYQGRMHAMVISAIRGEPFTSGSPSTTELTEREQTLVFMLLQNWFAALVGWSAGLGSVSNIVAQMDRAIRVISRGLEAESAQG
jgi:TetR/AcrR family transcriptional regulator, cholesterol catabolism regulator